jgi:hemoglobin
VLPSINQNNLSLYDRIGGQEALATLLRHFYADVRQHKLIGPIFDRQIKDWPAHLSKIGDFWARLTGGPSTYSGQMPAKHFGLGLDPRHFAAWLELWDANCRCYLQPREAEELSRLAHGIGQRLKSILSGGEACWAYRRSFVAPQAPLNEASAAWPRTAPTAASR